MPTFNVSVDLMIPVLLEIKARDADGAIEKLYSMPKRRLLKLANVDEAAIDLIEDSIDVDEV